MAYNRGLGGGETRSSNAGSWRSGFVISFCYSTNFVFTGWKKNICSVTIFSIWHISVAWFMFCLFVPLLWMDAVAVEVKLLMVTGILLLSGFNIVESFRRFNDKWNGQRESFRDGKLRRDGNLIDWDELIRSMNLSVDIYVPGVSPRMCVALSIVMVVSMLVGFFLKNIFPVFSAFAWGIPSALVVTLFFQAAGYNAAQACKVKFLEKKFKLEFEHR